MLQPLVDRLEHHVFAGSTIHTNDTPIPVRRPGRGKTKTDRLWSYVRDERPFGSDAPPAVFYKYTSGRKGIHPTGHLEGYQGHIHADGYSGDVGPLAPKFNWSVLLLMLEKRGNT